MNKKDCAAIKGAKGIIKKEIYEHFEDPKDALKVLIAMQAGCGG
jgi:hypothetical protein